MDSVDGNRKIEQAREDLYKLESMDHPNIDEIEHFTWNEHALENYKKQLDKRFYSTILFILTHKNYNEDKAKQIWQAIVKHKVELTKKLKRNPGISVATLDYMTNLADRMTDSVIIEEEKTDAIAQVAIVDKLTGLYLHSIFDVSLDKLVKMSHRYRDALSLIMIDVDDFKIINDTYGHQKGDEALSKVGIIIDKSIRDSDVAARYGGEEMAIILPRTDTDLAVEVAERIRLDVLEEFKDDLGITRSSGVSSIGESSASPEVLLKQADQALYQAKALGKNQVVIYRP